MNKHNKYDDIYVYFLYVQGLQKWIDGILLLPIYQQFLHANV